MLVQYLDWRSISLVNIPSGLMGLWLAYRYVASGSPHAHREFDPIGQVLAVATLAALTWWMISIGRPHATWLFTVVVGAGVVLLGLAFLTAEARQVRPMLPPDLLLWPALSAVAVVGLLHIVGIYGLIFALSLVFQELRGMSPVGAGLLFLPMTVMLAFGASAGARLLKTSNPFGPQIWGHAASAVGATVLASGILNSARQTGGVIGVALLGALIGEPATAAGVRWAAVTAAVALAGASGLAAVIARKPRASAVTPVEP